MAFLIGYVIRDTGLIRRRTEDFGGVLPSAAKFATADSNGKDEPAATKQSRVLTPEDGNHDADAPGRAAKPRTAKRELQPRGANDELDVSEESRSNGVGKHRNKAQKQTAAETTIAATTTPTTAPASDGTAPSADAPGDSPPALVPTNATVAVSNRGSPNEDNFCFTKRVMWQPSFCSHATDLAYKAIERTPLAAVPKRWVAAHIGSFDWAFRVAEYMDLFGVPSKGTLALGKHLYQKTKQRPRFCGHCCECVEADDEPIENATFVPHRIHALVPSDGVGGAEGSVASPAAFFGAKDGAEKGAATAASRGAGVADVVATRLPKSGSDAAQTCPAEFLAAVGRWMKESALVGPLLVLSLDMPACDPFIIRDVLAKRLAAAPSTDTSWRPAFVEFTQGNPSVKYEEVVAAMDTVGYHCAYRTQKPDRRRFRGVRDVRFPIAVALTKCWRGLYDLNIGERFRIACFDTQNAVASMVVGQLIRQSHRGNLFACGAPMRPKRLRKYFPDATERG